MTKTAKLIFLFLLTSFFISQESISQQLIIDDFVLFGGNGACPAGPGQTPPAVPGCGAIIGVGSRVLSGNVGSYRLVHTNGDVQINGKIHSGGTVNLGNNNVCTGIITANNSASLSGTILQAGSGMTLGGNIDVKGNIIIGGGSVSGRVTHPAGSTYSGPVPGGGEVTGAPSLPIMPDMPPVTIFPAAGATNVTSTQTINPGSYGNLTISNKTISFNGPGIYVFKSIKNSGTNTFRFNFQGLATGTIRIYVHGDVNLAAIQTAFPNGGDASRVYMEVQGKGNTNGGNGTYACIFTTGFNWSGTIWAPFAAIKAGSGSSQGTLAGCFWSGTQVDIEHGIRITHVPPLNPCKGSVTIVKQVDGPPPATDWEFTSPQLGNFTLPAAGGTKTFNNLDPGTYTIVEITKPNYVPSTTCSPGPDRVDFVITPALPCENLSCTLLNTYVDCPCIECDGTEVIVDQNVNINFNNNPPTYTGDPDLLPFFSFDKSGGATADKWKAIFDLGDKKLIIKSPAVISVSQVSGAAPGIDIRTTCEIETQKGSAVRVVSNNKDGGNINIHSNGSILINGEVTTQVTGCAHLPGAINIISKCGNQDIGGLVQILGVDPGGNTITILTCDETEDCISPPFPGDINISGLVKSYAVAAGGDVSPSNKPAVRVVSLLGAVNINANSAEPFQDDFATGGASYDVYPGLLAWIDNNAHPGKVEVQAKKNVTVNGHGTDPTGTVRKSFGAIASVATSSLAPGGIVDVRSITGKIIANDRAFDVSGKNKMAVNYARINLYAKSDITLSRPGATANFNPVVTAAGTAIGDKGGVNDIRSFGGNVQVGANALVTAAVPAGTGTVQGINNITHCTSFVNNGTVTPAPVVASLCSPAAPTGLYDGSLCPVVFPRQAITLNVPEKEIDGVTVFPNPAGNNTTVSYKLDESGPVSLRLFYQDGRLASRIFETAYLAPGTYNYQLNTSALPAGVYVVRYMSGKKSKSARLVVIK